MLVAPQALKSVLLVEDSFSNEEMRTCSRIRAHQSTSETFNTSLWKRKTKPTSVSYFAVVVLATNKICSCGTFPWRVSVFSVFWNIMFQKCLFITMSKKPASYFNQYSHIFSGILAGPRSQRQNCRQTVVNRGLYVCAGGLAFAQGGLTFKFDKNFTNL